MSAPALSWGANLKMARVKLGPIPEPDMYIFFEKGSRGRVSYLSNRYSKANKCLKSYDPKEESKHIIFLNANGYAMSNFHPASRFKWIDPKVYDLNKYTSNSSIGCVIEVDLEHPKELRELRKDYPLALIKMEIKSEMLSEYQWKIADICNISIGNVKKMVPNFCDKENYVVYYKNLQLYLRLELKLKKYGVH